MEKKITIAKKLTEWKKIFTEGLVDLNEHSSWRDIILSPQFNQEDILALTEKAEKALGALSDEELEFYNNLPYYEDVLHSLGSVQPATSGCFFYRGATGRNLICFLAHTTDCVNLLEVVIVTDEDIDPTVEMPFFFFDEELIEATTVRYSREVPREWFEELNKRIVAPKEHASIH